MGFVSLQEDSFERIEEGFEVLRQRLPELEMRRSDDALAFRTYFNAMERTLREIRGFLDLATDPSVELARDLAATRKRAERAEQDVTMTQERLAQIEQAYATERARAATTFASEREARTRAERQAHSLERDKVRLQQQVEEMRRTQRRRGR
jgi:predicted  nucleic acid-binding Zn-ribbon protein